MSSGYGNAPCGAYAYGLSGAESIALNWQPRMVAPIDRLAAVTFEVTNADLSVISLLVRAKTNLNNYEVVYSTDAGFADLYRRGSSLQSSSNSYLFVVRRTGGWTGGVVEFDVTGVEVAG